MSGSGRRRDGKPFKAGNTRDDGSFAVGKGRTPESTRFAAGDGRKRGKRPKGVRNFDTDWEEELTKTVRVTRNGKELKVSAHRAQVMRTLELASKGRERSQETVFRKADRLQERRSATSTKDDDAMIAQWLAQHSGAPAHESPTIVGDDDAGEAVPREAPEPKDDEDSSSGGEDAS